MLPACNNTAGVLPVIAAVAVLPPPACFKAYIGWLARS